MSEEPKYFMARSPGFPVQDPVTGMHDAKQRAAELGAEGRFFSAGHIMSNAVNATWGNTALMAEAQQAAIGYYERAIADNAACSLEALASLHKLRFEYLRTSRYFGIDQSVAQRKSRELSEELAQRMVECFENSAEADGFLVRGVQLSTDLLAG